MSRFIKLTLVLFILFITSPSRASDYHIFVGVGPNFEGVGSARFGIDDWEIGLLNNSAFGIDKLFKVKGPWYMGFGFGVVNRSTPIVYLAGGFETKLLWFLHLRGELNAVQSPLGYGFGMGVIGLSAHF